MTAPARRQMSPKAAAALAAGRARRAANLAATRQADEASEPVDQASQQDRLTPQALTSATIAPQTSAPRSPSGRLNGSPVGRDESDELRILFDDAPVDEPRPAKTSAVKPAKRPSPASRPVAATASSGPKGVVGGQGKAASGHAAKPPWIDEREERVAYNADKDAPTLGKVLVNVASYLMDKAAAPSQELAEDMARPALRLLYRNVPALMDMSPNAKDAGELIMACAIWSGEVADYRKRAAYSRGERRVKNAPAYYSSAYAPGNGATPYDNRPYEPPSGNGRGGYPASETPNAGATDGGGYADTGRSTASEAQIWQDLGFSQ